MKAKLPLAAIITTIGIGAVATNDPQPPWAGPTGTPIPVCYEDEPCWNCETMGNKICGP